MQRFSKMHKKEVSKSSSTSIFYMAEVAEPGRRIKVKKINAYILMHVKGYLSGRGWQSSAASFY